MQDDRLHYDHDICMVKVIRNCILPGETIQPATFHREITVISISLTVTNIYIVPAVDTRFQQKMLYLWNIILLAHKIKK